MGQILIVFIWILNSTIFIIVIFKLNDLCCKIFWTIIQQPSFMTVTHDHDFTTVITNPDHAQKPFLFADK